ncbi:hypothetical protein HN011_008733 [Eciton burchellii]|nr:hypothetical protein HN011_008733 [Eciton burchellii]
MESTARGETLSLYMSAVRSSGSLGTTRSQDAIDTKRDNDRRIDDTSSEMKEFATLAQSSLNRERVQRKIRERAAALDANKTALADCSTCETTAAIETAWRKTFVGQEMVHRG